MNTFGHILKGYYKLSIVDPDDCVIWQQPDFKENLILETGLARIHISPYADCFAYFSIGTGSRANEIYSGNGTISAGQSENNDVMEDFVWIYDIDYDGIYSFIQKLEGYEALLEIGDYIQFITGSVPYLNVNATANINNYIAQINRNPGTFGPNRFPYIIKKTSQKRLHGESKRTNSSAYVSGQCGTTVVGNAVIYQRTIQFTAETSDVTYKEMGTSWSSTFNSELFSRFLLDPPITMSVGQKLRCEYKLYVILSPSTAVTSSANIFGWPVAPATNTNITESIQTIVIGQVLSNGTSGGGNTLDPSTTNTSNDQHIWISNLGGVAPFGTAIERVGTSVWDYSPISRISNTDSMSYQYYCYKEATFNVNQMNRTDIKNFGLSNGWPWYYRNAYIVEFDQTQSKSDNQSLNLQFKWEWNRG